MLSHVYTMTSRSVSWQPMPCRSSIVRYDGFWSESCATQVLPRSMMGASTWRSLPTTELTRLQKISSGAGSRRRICAALREVTKARQGYHRQMLRRVWFPKGIAAGHCHVPYGERGHGGISEEPRAEQTAGGISARREVGQRRKNGSIPLLP